MKPKVPLEGCQSEPAHWERPPVVTNTLISSQEEAKPLEGFTKPKHLSGRAERLACC
ncbi:hypothetical protein Cadr_000010833 [Camelus dromedarius]|uniref:Uncharacterized protein n=1 Tax=Camelus dromedarius TaxID=9838 RepID=A0A5N4DVK6_CAMDR|nr:hypothetical protein Cadr_000010833 [Camelus dromedarius]